MYRFSLRPNSAHLVHWRPWGQGAFDEAARLDKPLAVFITAFWCGFCQRLDETTLSDDQVISLLNGLFVPVRLEEAERPDVDLRYNQDGWPTVAFLTANGTHLASVNYTPPQEFIGLLARVVNYYQQHPAELDGIDPKSASDEAQPDVAAPLTPDLVEEVSGMLEGLADPEFGGFGGDLKMLHTEANDFFLYRYATTGEATYLDHVLLTLRRLRASNSFDSKDGGFFRYSSRRDWQEPHPEKLLDDQATLLNNYLHAYLLSDDVFYREVAEGLIDYMDRTLSDEASHPYFYGCQDYVRFEEDGQRQLRSLIDSHIYCDANAHAASAYFNAWWLLGREDCGERARAIVDGLWSRFRDESGGMNHYWDGELHTPGLLQDSLAAGVAYLDASVTLEEASYRDRARDVAEYLVSRHRGVEGGFVDISRPGPASLRFPLALLTQNSTAARFFVRLADLTGEPAYRKWAQWSLLRFPNSHRQHGAFAASFGHALASLFSGPVAITLTGSPGDTSMRSLLRAALTQLRLPGMVVRYARGPVGALASVEIHAGVRTIGPITDPISLTPALLSSP